MMSVAPKHLPPLLLAVLLVSLAPVARAQDEAAREHLRKGRELVSAGDTMLAVAEFERAVDAAPNLADAHYEIGHLLTQRANAVETDFGDRKRAEEALLKALKLEPHNPRYILELGKLRLKQHMPIDAERLFSRALDEAQKSGDPEVLAEVHFNLGFIEERRYQSMRDRRFSPLGKGPPAANVDQMYDPRPARYINRYLAENPVIDESGELTKEKMLEHYRAALKADPGHVGAATHLMGFLLDEERLSEYLSLARGLIDVHPERPEPYLYYGLGLHRAGHEDQAAAAFDEALARLPDEDRGAIENLAPVLRREAAEHYEDMDSAQRKAFQSEYWRLKDPLYLTTSNEGYLEHLARVAYADLRFSAPSADERGWETDRGIIYIRYGPPKESGTFAPSTTNYGDPYAIGRRSIVWSYGKDGPVFVFRQMPGYMDAKFAGDYKFIADEYRYAQPSSYDNIPSIPELMDVPVQIARFKGDSPGDVAVEVDAGLPLDSLGRNLDVKKGEVEVGIFVLNSEGQTVLRRVDNETVQYTDTSKTDGLRSWRLLMPAGGPLVAAVEARDALSWRSAASRDTFTATPFSDDSLGISDILMGDYLRPLVKDPQRRTDFDIMPNPGLKFESGDPVSLYYELYGLGQDDEGFASYDVALAVRVKKVYRSGPLANFLGTLADAWGFSVVGDDRLELRYSREVKVADHDRVVEYLNLNLKKAPPGEYEIRLRVWDRLAKRLTTRLRSFEVVDAQSTE